MLHAVLAYKVKSAQWLAHINTNIYNSSYHGFENTYQSSITSVLICSLVVYVCSKLWV